MRIYSQNWIGVLVGLILALPGAAQVTISTVAGGFVPDTMQAATATFRGLSGLAMAPDGSVIITDGDASVIWKLRLDGMVERVAGDGTLGMAGDGDPARNARLNGPASPGFDGAGNLYFADTQNFRIRKIDTAGVISTVAGTGIRGSLGQGGPANQAQLADIYSLAVSPAGEIFFTESSANRVRRVSTDGVLSLVAGSAAGRVCSGFAEGSQAVEAALCNPFAIAVNQDGEAIFSDGLGLWKVTKGGSIVRVSRDGGGWSLALDAKGDLLSAGGTIVRYGAAGVAQILLPAVAVTDVNFLTAKPGGQIVFANFERVYEFAPAVGAASVAAVAGTLETAIVPNGTLASSLNRAGGPVAENSKGQVYFSGPGCAIYRAGADQRITRILGNGCSVGAQAADPLNNAQLASLSAAAADPQDRFVFATGNTVFRVESSGTVTKLFSVAQQISGLAIDGSGRYYVLDANGLSRVTAEGQAEDLRPWYATLFRSRPDAVALDTAGRVYLVGIAAVGASNLRSIYRFTPAGVATKIADIVSGIRGLAVDRDGTVWFTNGAILYRVENGSQWFAATGGEGPNDGPLASASVRAASITGTASGDILVVDSGLARVRRIHIARTAARPVIFSGGIANAASLVAGPVAPGELISIFGSNLAPEGLQTFTLQNNVVPPGIAGVRVWFGSTPGRITAISPGQINVFVPYFFFTGPVDIAVEVDGVTSAAMPLTLAPVAFGLSTADASGSGAGAILNQDFSYNGAANPAAAGSIVTLYGTGEGLLEPHLSSGALVISQPFSTPTAGAVTVLIGGRAAQVLYAGSAPFLPAGVMQLNVRIPGETQPGAAPIEVRIGSTATTRAVTVAVR